ncbi:MAG: response regulator [Deltaproteobacteria bacterium]|nr:response regulator [Deltaproteobacteria bacterium]
MSDKRSVLILLADDDVDDREMARDALVESRLKNEMRFVEHGVELLEYLCHRGKYAVPSSAPRPGLILLDLNMPKMDGREALCEIRRNPDLRRIPVIIMTTSQAEEDIARSYDLGANSFIKKPINFVALVEVMRSLGRYWFEIVELPE